jgi:response regulator RpfG family c-di-GMP phosphodiesterase
VTEPLTLLFVDDEPIMLSAVRRLLDEAPFEVLTADCADAALAILRKRPIDVLISDVDMPGLSGLELIAIARHEFPSTLRMLLTAFPSQDRVMRAINEGEVARFFVKPFDSDEFREAIDALAHRIERERRDRTEGAHQERRKALIAWANERFPGVVEIARHDDGAVRIDLEETDWLVGHLELQ